MLCSPELELVMHGWLPFRHTYHTTRLTPSHAVAFQEPCHTLVDPDSGLLSNGTLPPALFA